MFSTKTIIFLLLAFLALQVSSECPNAKSHLKSSLPKPKNGDFTLFTWGLDLFSQNSLTGKTLKCLADSKRYTRLGLMLGFSTWTAAPINPVSYSNDAVQAFLNNSLEKDLIIYINFNDTSDAKLNTYIQNHLKPFVNNTSLIRKVWIRPNIDKNCPAPPTSYANCQVLPTISNIAILTKAVFIITQLGFEPGIYCSKEIWNLAFLPGSTKSSLKDLDELPLVYDDSDYSDIDVSYDSWKPFGVWKTPHGKMSGYWYIDQTCCWPGQIVWTKA